MTKDPLVYIEDIKDSIKAMRLEPWWIEHTKLHNGTEPMLPPINPGFISE